jgi:signal transduction histidine kinase
MLAQTAQRVKVEVQLAAEERIHKSESQLAEAQRIAHLGSWEWNVETGKVNYSEEMYRIHDLEPQERPTYPRRFLARVHPDDRHQTIEHLRHAYRSQEPFNFEHRIHLSDGETRILQTRGRFLVDRSGRRMVGTTEDVTERVRAEQLRHRLMQEKATAQEAVGARDEFLSVVSHELRSPLTSLSLHIQALTARSKSSQRLTPAALATKLDTIDHQVRRLIRLANNLLDLSRITLGRLELERELLNLAELAREAVARNNESIAHAGCAVMLTGDDPVVGSWDRLRLEQVLDNLLSNAVKYGAGKPIEIDVRRQGGEACLAIRDHGQGIPREHQTRIFQKFERVATLRQSGGLGLGLWIVREVVTALGGSVSVSSEPGEGSTFVVALPLHAGSQSAALQGKTG